MATLGSLEFGEVRGVITPATVPVIEGVENPALILAVLALTGTDRIDSLIYRDFFSASQAATLHALVGTEITAGDETGTAFTVLVRSCVPSERPARCAGVLGVWVEVSVGVTAWA